jgi:hypothetical protein
MKLVGRWFLISLFASFACLAGRFAGQGSSLFWGFMLVVFGAWMAGWKNGWTWMPGVGFSTALLLAGIGAFQDKPGLLPGLLPELLILTATICALAAWDLNHFGNNLRRTDTSNQSDELVSGHLRRLMGVCGASCVLGTLTIGIQINMPLGLAIFLGITLMAGLAWVVRANQESQGQL